MSLTASCSLASYSFKAASPTLVGRSDAEPFVFQSYAETSEGTLLINTHATDLPNKHSALLFRLLSSADHPQSHTTRTEVSLLASNLPPKMNTYSRALQGQSWAGPFQTPLKTSRHDNPRTAQILKGCYQYMQISAGGTTFSAANYLLVSHRTCICVIHYLWGERRGQSNIHNW